eukprot:scaffold86350_cov27-Tisochrysis_lutea.AAC.2
MVPSFDGTRPCAPRLDPGNRSNRNEGSRGGGGGREDNGNVGVEIGKPRPSRCVAQNLQIFPP